MGANGRRRKAGRASGALGASRTGARADGSFGVAVDRVGDSVEMILFAGWCATSVRLRLSDVQQVVNLLTEALGDKTGTVVSETVTTSGLVVAKDLP